MASSTQSIPSPAGGVLDPFDCELLDKWLASNPPSSPTMPAVPAVPATPATPSTPLVARTRAQTHRQEPYGRTSRQPSSARLPRYSNLPKKLTTPSGNELDIQYKENSPEFRKSFKFSYMGLVQYLAAQGPRHPKAWIQTTPSGVNHRYLNGKLSTQCRIHDCPCDHTISTGQFRVCFDEFSLQTTRTMNPYHTAGFAHLYCFETACNRSPTPLIHLCLDPKLDIGPDDRAYFAQEKKESPMALPQDLIGVYERWVEEVGAKFQNFRAYHPNARFEPAREDCLWYRIEIAKRRSEPHGSNKTIDERIQDDAAPIEARECMGDISVLAELARLKSEKTPEARARMRKLLLKAPHQVMPAYRQAPPPQLLLKAPHRAMPAYRQAPPQQPGFAPYMMPTQNPMPPPMPSPYMQTPQLQAQPVYVMAPQGYPGYGLPVAPPNGYHARQQGGAYPPQGYYAPPPPRPQGRF